MTDLTFDIATSTRLELKSANFFTSKFSGKAFTAEYFPIAKRLALSMGIAHASGEQKNALLRFLTDRFRINKDNVLFDLHSVCLDIPADQEWLSKIDRIIESLSQWACENNVHTGCFICGKCDDTVHVSEVGEIRSFLCEECRTSIRQDFDKTLKLKNIEAENIARAEKASSEHILRGILAATGVGILLSVVWQMAAGILPFYWIFMPFLTAILVNLIYATYKKVADGFGTFGFVTTTIISAFLLTANAVICYCYSVADGLNSLQSETVYTAFSILPNIGMYLNSMIFRLAFAPLVIVMLLGFFFGFGYRLFREKVDL